MLITMLVLNAVALLISIAALVIACVVLYRVVRVGRAVNEVKATVAGAESAIIGSNKEVAERLKANISLLRKRIDELERLNKRHSTRIDLLKTDVTRTVAANHEALTTKLDDLARDVNGEEDDLTLEDPQDPT
ncbi:MAG TPA: hypothetical protein VGK19_20755 [Capsulimonadaceae bacterium]|jgi:hypothetical protein